VTTKSFRALLASAYFLAIGVPLLTALIIIVGPDPVLGSSKYFSPGFVVIDDVRDRFALIGWWVLAGVAGLIVYRSFLTQSEDPVNIKPDSRLWLILVSLVTLLFLAGLVVRLDTTETDNWKRVDFSVIAISLLILVAVAAIPRLCRGAQIALRAFFGVVLATCLAALIQTPATIRDVSHFIDTSNELLAPAAGFYPLSNFVAQYNNLLAFPIVPFVHVFPDRGILILVAYLLLLQLFCLCVPALVARIVGYWKLALPMTLIPVVLVTSSNVNGHAPHTYFQSFPMRSAVPSLLLILLVWVVSRSNELGKLRPILLGVVATLCAVNNPDFGATAAVSSMVVMMLYENGLLSRVRAIGFAAIGGIFSLGGLWVMYSIIGQTLRLEYLVKFVRLAGAAAAPMPIGGIPIVMVTGFCLGSALGIYAIGRARRVRDRKVWGATAFLLFSSLWGLLSLPYYAGRSYASTAIGGHSYQLGLVISGVVLYLALDIQHLRDQAKQVGAPGFIFPVIAIAFISLSASAYFSVPSPLTSLNSVQARGQQFRPQVLITEEIDSLRQRDILSESPEHIGLLLPVSNALQLSGAGRSLLVAMAPVFAEQIPEFAKLQCEAVIQSDVTVIIEDAARVSILNLPPCDDILQGSIRLEYDGPVLRVLRRGDTDVASP